MARLVAIGTLLWVVWASIGYSVANFPEPAEAAVLQHRPSPVDAIAEAALGVDDGLDPEALSEPYRGTRAFSAGAYAVEDSSDPKLAARDRDYRPRRPIFVTEERQLEDGRDTDREDRGRSGRNDGRGRSVKVDDDDDDDRDGPSRRLVEGEIEPGLYTTSFAAEDCSYELWRVMRDRSTRVIAEEHLTEGRVLVSINAIEPDWITSSDGCGDWYPWERLATPLETADDGDYWIGDLAPGVWFVPKPCRWEKVVSFRGATIGDVTDSGAGPGSLTIDYRTLGVRIRGCRTPITLSSGDAVYAP